MVIDILIMLSFHYFADFVLQPDELRKRKDKSMFIMVFHCLLYATVVMMGYLTVINIPIWYRYSRLSFIMLFMSHLFIDLGKRTVHNTILKNNKQNKHLSYCKIKKLDKKIFAIDQLCHIMIILLIYFCK